MKFSQNKGILFWITGLSGSGKTTIGRKIKREIIKIYGPTIHISGDDLRKIFKINKYDHKSRLKYGKKCCNFAKFITDQKINFIFSIIGMAQSLRDWNRKNIDNYIEIYIKSNIKQILKKKIKKLYTLNKSPVVGINIKPEFPKKPNIVINNNFKKNTQQLANELINKLKKI